MSDDGTLNTGVPASPSGSRASHEAASASSPEALIPNAVTAFLDAMGEKVDLSHIALGHEETDAIRRGDALSAIRDSISDSVRLVDPVRRVVQNHLQAALRRVWQSAGIRVATTQAQTDVIRGLREVQAEVTKLLSIPAYNRIQDAIDFIAQLPADNGEKGGGA